MSDPNQPKQLNQPPEVLDVVDQSFDEDDGDEQDLPMQDAAVAGMEAVASGSSKTNGSNGTASGAERPLPELDLDLSDIGNSEAYLNFSAIDLGGGTKPGDRASGVPVEAPRPTDAARTADSPSDAMLARQSMSSAAFLSSMPSWLAMRDSYAMDVETTFKRTSILDKDDPAREFVMRDLAEKFEFPKSYSEKLAAAKALIELGRGEDGKLGEYFVQRDVFEPEKAHDVYSSTGRGGGRTKVGRVVDQEARHVLTPLRSQDVLDFYNNSVPVLEQDSKALVNAPLDSVERHNHIQKLVHIFQTYDDNSPERMTAAINLQRFAAHDKRTGGDVLGSTTEVKDSKVVENKRYTKEVQTTKEKATTVTDVEAFLNRKSDGLLRQTAIALDSSSDPSLKPKHVKTALDVFFDSKNKDDRVAAAVSLLELGRGENGVVSDSLGTRQVHIPAITESVRVNKTVGGRSVQTNELREKVPARDETQELKREDVIRFLREETKPPADAYSRFLSAETLNRHKLLSEEEYGRVLDGILKDEKAPASLQRKVREIRGMETLIQEAIDEEERTKDAPQAVPLKEDQKKSLELTFERLLQNPELSHLVSEEDRREMKSELAKNEFGPASRKLYNMLAAHMTETTNDLAVGLILRNVDLPDGCPIEVPKDESGRAEGSPLFRSDVITGRTKLEIKQLEAGEAPDVKLLDQTSKWCVDAIQKLDEVNLRFKVKEGDEIVSAIAKDGSLDAWKSKEGMTLDQLKALHVARSEWLGAAMAVRNYANTIGQYHSATKATSDANTVKVEVPLAGKYSFNNPFGTDIDVFSDEALKNFPGTIERNPDGSIKALQIRLPESLDRQNIENQRRMSDIREWLNKYGPPVNQVTTEVALESVQKGRLLLWGDVPADEVDETTGKHVNMHRMRFEAQDVMVKLEDGSTEKRIKVTSSDQKSYVNWWAYQDIDWFGAGVDEIGKPDESGQASVNGTNIFMTRSSIGTNGDIVVKGTGIDPEHALVRVSPEGQIFIWANNPSTYIDGRPIGKLKDWVEVPPGQQVTLGDPRPTLSMVRNEQGQISINGSVLKVNEEVPIGRKGVIGLNELKIDDAQAANLDDQHAVIKVGADGNMYIKNNSEKGTFVNGKQIDSTKWTKISLTDKVTFGGTPPAELAIVSDVRLYKPDDMVTIMLDGQMQLMRADKLGEWAESAKKWHYGGKAAVFAMDAAMVVTGTIEMRAALGASQVAARAAARVAYREAAAIGGKAAGRIAAKDALKVTVSSWLRAEGAKTGLRHAILGGSGFFHRALENAGPWGRKINEFRGYAMMFDIFHGSVIKDGGTIGRRLLGMKPASEGGSVLRSYLETSTMANRLHKASDWTFFLSNFYFIPEITGKQVPHLIERFSGANSTARLKSGAEHLGYEHQNNQAAERAPEARLIGLQSDETRRKIFDAQASAIEVAHLSQPEKIAEAMLNNFVNAQNLEDKRKSALALISFNVHTKGQLSDVLAASQSADGKPIELTLDEAQATLLEPLKLSQDELQIINDVREAKQVSDLSKLTELNTKLMTTFRSSDDPMLRASAAVALQLLHQQKDGTMPAVLGELNVDGTKTAVRSASLKEFFDRHYQGVEQAVKSSQELFVELMASNYRNATTTEDKLTAALAMVAYRRESPSARPDVVATAPPLERRNIHPIFDPLNPQSITSYAKWALETSFAATGVLPLAFGTPSLFDKGPIQYKDLPENITVTELETFLSQQNPGSFSLYDKQIASRMAEESKPLDVAINTPSGSTERNTLMNELLDEFANGKTDADRMAAALSLIALQSTDNTGEKVGSINVNGSEQDVTLDSLRQFTADYQRNALIAKFDRMDALMTEGYSTFKQARMYMSTPPGQRSPQFEQRLSEFKQELLRQFKRPESNSTRTTAGIALMFLATDPATGAVSREFVSGKLDGKQVSLSDEEVLRELKSSIFSRDPGSRMAIAELLYRRGESSMGGSSPLVDYGGVLLSVLQDKRATFHEKLAAMVSSDGIALGDIMDIHRRETEPAIEGMDATSAGLAQANLYGRGSNDIEKALFDIFKDKDQDQSLRAIAASLVIGSSQQTVEERRRDLERVAHLAETAPDTVFAELFKGPKATLEKYYGKNPTDHVDGDAAKQDEVYRAARLIFESGNAKELGVDEQQLAKAFLDAFDLKNPVRASDAIGPILHFFNQNIEAGSRELVAQDVIRAIQGGPNPSVERLALQVNFINQLGEMSKTLGPEFKLEAQNALRAMLKTGSSEHKNAHESVRVAAIKALVETGATDKQTLGLLETALGARGLTLRDESAKVRSAAIDALNALKPANLRDLTLQLLELETDPNVLDKLQAAEQANRWIDPDSAEYRERYRRVVQKMLTTNMRSLADTPSWIWQQHPTFFVENLDAEVHRRHIAKHGEHAYISGNFTSNEADLIATQNKVRQEALNQLEQVIKTAATPGGDQERRALTWLLMSNASSFDPAIQDQVITRCAYGLYEACRSDPKTKEAVAPLIAMSLSTQDRMPPHARNFILYGMINLHPEIPGGPISKQDAGIAVLEGLKRQLHRTPTDPKAPDYDISHQLQMKMLEMVERYATPDAIPVLEAMSVSDYRQKIIRDDSGRISEIVYPNNLRRQITYDGSNRIESVKEISANGMWLVHKQNQPSELSIDQETADFKVNNSGNAKTFTAAGATVHSLNDKVFRVDYPDLTSREFDGSHYVYTDRTGKKDEWSRDPKTQNTWYRDTDTQKAHPLVLEVGFDTAGKYTRKTPSGETRMYHTDGGTTVTTGDVVISTAGVGDVSRHPMPVVRERAQQLLANLRDNTKVLRDNVEAIPNATPEQLAAHLKAAMDDPKGTSESVAKAIFEVAKSSPLTPNDPRLPLYREILQKSSHERIQLAVARTLFASDSEADRKLAAKVIGDVAKNGSRLGYRQDAQQFIEEFSRPTVSAEDRALIADAVNTTPLRSRTNEFNPRRFADRPLEYQEQYENAKSLLSTGKLYSLDALQSADWWKNTPYSLLHDGNADEQWNIEGHVTIRGPYAIYMDLSGDYSALYKKGDEALEKFNKRVRGQWDAMINDAGRNDAEGDNARKALAYIVLTNGASLTYNREDLVVAAANKLSQVYLSNQHGSSFARQIMEDILIANPRVSPAIRESFAIAIFNKTNQTDQSLTAESKPRTAVLLAAALESEQWLASRPGQAGYAASIKLQRTLVEHLKTLDVPMVLPVVQAIADKSPDWELRDSATVFVDKYRYDTREMLTQTKPDLNSSPDERLRGLRDALRDATSPDYFVCGEIFKFAHPQTFDRSAAVRADDPRIQLLQDAAMNHKVERVRLAAARVLQNVVPDDPISMQSIMQLGSTSKIPRIENESFDLLDVNLSRKMISGESDPRVKLLREAAALQPGDDRQSWILKAEAMQLLQQAMPTDATAARAILETASQWGFGGRGQAIKLIQDSLKDNPPGKIENDPRVPMLREFLKSGTVGERQTAAWWLSHSPNQADFKLAVDELARMATNRGDGVHYLHTAQTALRDMIYDGNDEQSKYAREAWQAAFDSSEDKYEFLKPPAFTERDQTERYFRLHKDQFYAHSQDELKTYLMHLTGASEAAVEDSLRRRRDFEDRSQHGEYDYQPGEFSQPVSGKDFTDFLRYVNDTNPDLFKKDSIDKVKLASMLQQYLLHQRSGLLPQGTILNGNLFDPQTQFLMSNPKNKYHPAFRHNPSFVSETYRQDQKFRADSLRKSLDKELDRRPDSGQGKLRWHPSEPVSVKPPEFISKPQLDSLAAYSSDVAKLLPEHLKAGDTAGDIKWSELAGFSETLDNGMKVTYDFRGRIAETTDMLAQTRSYKYDHSNRLIEMTMPDGQVWTMHNGTEWKSSRGGSMSLKQNVVLPDGTLFRESTNGDRIYQTADGSRERIAMSKIQENLDALDNAFNTLDRVPLADKVVEILSSLKPEERLAVEEHFRAKSGEFIKAVGWDNPQAYLLDPDPRRMDWGSWRRIRDILPSVTGAGSHRRPGG